MTCSHGVIVIRHAFAQLRVFEHFTDVLDIFPGQITVHDDQVETFGFDILYEDGIAVDEKGFFEIDRLQKGIAEAFVKAGVGDEIGMGVKIPERWTIRCESGTQWCRSIEGPPPAHWA